MICWSCKCGIFCFSASNRKGWLVWKNE